MIGEMLRLSCQPTEAYVVTENVAVELWGSLDVHRKYFFRWALSRLDCERTLRKTFDPKHLFELPEVIRALADEFSRLHAQNETERAAYLGLASVMESAIEQLKPIMRDAETPSHASVDARSKS